MIALLFAAALVAAPAESAAEPAGEPPATVVSDDDAARALYTGAKQLYDSGQFEAARGQFQAAFAKKALPGFLFNIGQCERQLGNHERAVFFFERYLDEKPDASNRAMVEELLAESRARMAAGVSSSQTPPAVVAAPAKRPGEAAAATATAPETEGGSGWVPWAVVVGATAAVALVGTGAVVWWASQPSLGVHDGRNP